MKFNFLENPSVIKLFTMFEKENNRLYVVGGAVRDEFLGIKTNDIDFATATRPEKVLEILNANNIEVNLKGMKFGTISATIDDEKFDITTFRKDSYARGSRFPEIVCSKKIRDDFIRRDFTINALYVEKFGRVIDLGGGVEDLEKGIVKFIISPRKSVFFDPLRILRYFRFCSLYFYENFDDASLRACIDKFQRVIRAVPRKRIKEEVKKILAGPGAEVIVDIWKKNDIMVDIVEYIEDENDE